MGRTFLFDIRFRCCLFTHAIVFTVTYRYNGFASTDDARFFGVKSGHRCARFLFSLVDLVIELAVSYIFFKPVAKLSMLRPLNCIRHRIKHKYINLTGLIHPLLTRVLILEYYAGKNLPTSCQNPSEAKCCLRVSTSPSAR